MLTESSETIFFCTFTFEQSTLIYSAHLLRVNLDVDGECFAAMPARPLGQQQNWLLAAVLHSLDSGTLQHVEILNLTPVLPHMSKHFHCNESLFPGLREKMLRPEGEKKTMHPHTCSHTDAHRQRGLERALAVSCWRVWEFRQPCFSRETTAWWFALMRETKHKIRSRFVCSFGLRHYQSQ